MDLAKPIREDQEKWTVVMKKPALNALREHVRQRLLQYRPAAELMPQEEQVKLVNDLGKYTVSAELAFGNSERWRRVKRLPYCRSDETRHFLFMIKWLIQKVRYCLKVKV